MYIRITLNTAIRPKIEIETVIQRAYRGVSKQKKTRKANPKHLSTMLAKCRKTNSEETNSILTTLPPAIPSLPNPENIPPLA